MDYFFLFNIWGGVGSRKMNIFWGMKILWICLGVITKGVISMHFRVVSKGQGTELGIFFWVSNISFFLGGGGGEGA